MNKRTKEFDRLERYLNMKTNKDELLARIESADPAKHVGLPQVELPKRKPSLRIRPLYLAPIAAAGAIALALSISNTSPLIVANADQLSEYQQAMQNYGFSEEKINLIDSPELITPVDRSDANTDSADDSGDQQTEINAEVTPEWNVDVVIHPLAHDFIKPGEIYRAKIAQDFDSRFKAFQELFGPSTEKFSYGKLGGFNFDNRSDKKWSGCETTSLDQTPPQASTLAIIKRYVSTFNLRVSDIVYDYLDFYCETSSGPVFEGSWIEIHETLNGALLENAVTIQTNSEGEVDSAIGLISDYELMSTENLLPLNDVYKESTETMSPVVANFSGKRFQPVTNGKSKHTVAAVPMYIPVFAQNGEKWYVPVYNFIYWNALSNSALAVQSDLVDWKR